MNASTAMHTQNTHCLFIFEPNYLDIVAGCYYVANLNRICYELSTSYLFKLNDNIRAEFEERSLHVHAIRGSHFNVRMYRKYSLHWSHCKRLCDVAAHNPLVTQFCSACWCQFDSRNSWCEWFKCGKRFWLNYYSLKLNIQLCAKFIIIHSQMFVEVIKAWSKRYRIHLATWYNCIVTQIVCFVFTVKYDIIYWNDNIQSRDSLS